MSNKNKLPYFKQKNTNKTNQVAKFFLRKIVPHLRKKSPLHYLYSRRTDLILQHILLQSKKYNYFLKIDIEKYFPTIDHKILLKNLPQIIKTTTKKNLSRQTKKYLKNDISIFLAKNPLKNKGLPLGNYLGYVLSGIYLLPIDFILQKNKYKYIRYQDDYLIFGKTKKDLEKLLTEKINPLLNSLNLELNIKKLQTGRFHKDRLTFLGYDYFGGHFLIDQEKIENFKKRIIKITDLRSKKSTKSVIKNLNYKISGFGHYYKFCSAKNIFQNLDGFIRMRLRRYIMRTKNTNKKFGNILLTNNELQKIGLLSLNNIYLKYTQKLKPKIKKYCQKLSKTNNNKDLEKVLNIKENVDKIWLNRIFKELKELAKNNKKINKRLKKIEEKLDNLKTR